MCLLLGTLAVFQVFLVLGAPLGRFAWGGQHRVLPAALRVGSAISITIYALIATVVLARAELLTHGIPQGLLRTATWVIAAYFFVGIWRNLASRSKPERAVMSPLVAMLCGLCVVAAIN